MAETHPHGARHRARCLRRVCGLWRRECASAGRGGTREPVPGTGGGHSSHDYARMWNPRVPEVRSRAWIDIFWAREPRRTALMNADEVSYLADRAEQLVLGAGWTRRDVLKLGTALPIAAEIARLTGTRAARAAG